MKLKEIRIAAGVSQEKLATELGLHFTTVSKWETGKTALPHYHYKKIAEILGMAEYEFAMLLDEVDDQIDLSGWEARVLQNKDSPILAQESSRRRLNRLRPDWVKTRNGSKSNGQRCSHPELFVS